MISTDPQPGSGSAPGKFNVLIVGGGVAAVEAGLALHDLGAEQIATTIVAPEPEFVYRPMTVREPFAYAAAKRYQLDRIARDIGAQLLRDSFKWLDHEQRVVHTESGRELSYDALLLALGARLSPRYAHTSTMDDTRMDELLHGLIQDIEEGYTHSLALVVPPGRVWPLPIYDFALMSAERAYAMDVALAITIITPEDRPLAIFGTDASDGVQQLLDKYGVATFTSAHCEVRESGHITIHPGPRQLIVDRIVALPELVGPSMAGVPAGATGGFVPVDVHGKVRGLDRVYAAGDATDFPIKHGGIAAQQADLAAEAILALAGLGPDPRPFHPTINGMLLTGGEPLYLSAQVTGIHGSHSQVTAVPAASPPAKITAKYLTPYLAELDRAATAG